MLLCTLPYFYILLHTPTYLYMLLRTSMYFHVLLYTCTSFCVVSCTMTCFMSSHVLYKHHMNRRQNGCVFTHNLQTKGWVGKERGGTLGMEGRVDTRPFERLVLGWLYEETSVQTSNRTFVRTCFVRVVLQLVLMPIV